MIRSFSNRALKRYFEAGDPTVRLHSGWGQITADPTVMIHLIIFFLIVAFIIWVNYRNAQAMRSAGPGSQRRRGGAVITPGGSGDWGGGWSSGGDSGGGGWSGGGGDFGGGGASGSW